LDGPNIIDFASLKVRVVAAITAIAAIGLLEDSITLDQANKPGVVWDIAILLVFVVSGVLLAWMDRLSAARQ
jgi:uncharacterized protein (TIGR00645 family)